MGYRTKMYRSSEFERVSTGGEVRRGAPRKGQSATNTATRTNSGARISYTPPPHKVVVIPAPDPAPTISVRTVTSPAAPRSNARAEGSSAPRSGSAATPTNGSANARAEGSSAPRSGSAATPTNGSANSRPATNNSTRVTTAAPRKTTPAQGSKYSRPDTNNSTRVKETLTRTSSVPVSTTPTENNDRRPTNNGQDQVIDPADPNMTIDPNDPYWPNNIYPQDSGDAGYSPKVSGGGSVPQTAVGEDRLPLDGTTDPNAAKVPFKISEEGGILFGLLIAGLILGRMFGKSKNEPVKAKI